MAILHAEGKYSLIADVLKIVVTIDVMPLHDSLNMWLDVIRADSTERQTVFNAFSTSLTETG